MDNMMEKEVNSMKEYIENALELMLKGNTMQYHTLIRQLLHTNPSLEVNQREIIYRTLPQCISNLTKDPSIYRDLFDAIFKYDFMGTNTEMKAYTNFIIHLVSSNTVYVSPSIHMLARNLCRPQNIPLPDNLESLVSMSKRPTQELESIEGKEESMDKKNAMEIKIGMRFQIVLETLVRILSLVPTASNVLFPILCEHFPHRRLETCYQLTYVGNLLQLIDHIPEMMDRILGLIIDQFVQIDVEIQLDPKENEEDLIFTMDDFIDDDQLPELDPTKQLDVMAEKLDHLMVLLFQFIHDLMIIHSTSMQGKESAGTSDITLQPTSSTRCFKALLHVFERSILSTHKCKYPQFILFYVAHMDPQFQDIFISQLLTVSLDPQVPSIMRTNCGAYLGSFVARAKFISVAYCQKALYHLLKWLHDQMDIYDTLQVLENAHKQEEFQEKIYIATLQTVCYILCFRGLEIAQVENGWEFLRSLAWERIIWQKNTLYCPLRFIQSTVAMEFINVIEALSLVSEDCIAAIDPFFYTGKKMKTKGKSTESQMTSYHEKKGTNLVATSTSTTKTIASATIGFIKPLETFFPFDPYLLRRSFKYIGPLYLYWKHADPMNADNSQALEAVKKEIQVHFDTSSSDTDSELEEGEGDSDNDGVDINDMQDTDDEGLYQAQDYDVHMISTSAPGSSPPISSYQSNTGHEDYILRSPHRFNIRRPPRKVSISNPPPSSLTFDIMASPALSASSPPSQLPYLGDSASFALGGYEDDEEDTGF